MTAPTEAPRQIVIVGASLAGLRAAETLRDEGFNGRLTIIGDERHQPYDRPPLSKQVLKGWVPADHTELPQMRELDSEDERERCTLEGHESTFAAAVVG